MSKKLLINCFKGSVVPSELIQLSIRFDDFSDILRGCKMENLKSQLWERVEWEWQQHLQF